MNCSKSVGQLNPQNGDIKEAEISGEEKEMRNKTNPMSKMAKLYSQ